MLWWLIQLMALPRDLAWVQTAGADAVFRKHHARNCDFRAL